MRDLDAGIKTTLIKLTYDTNSCMAPNSFKVKEKKEKKKKNWIMFSRKKTRHYDMTWQK